MEKYKIKAEEVKKIRELTGAGMLDCRKAFERFGNIEEAVEYLKIRPPIKIGR